LLVLEPPLDGPKQAGVMPLDLVHGWISAQVTPLNVKNRTNRIAFLSFNASAMKSNTFFANRRIEKKTSIKVQTIFSFRKELVFHRQNKINYII
jgi:hypothetical protein